MWYNGFKRKTAKERMIDMCDTFGKLGSAVAYFAKNSDRSPNEAQVLEYHPAAQDLSGTVACTYITIPQASAIYGVLLSRPSWMWGAEMGVNEWGLCIGNEAVFTKGAYGKTGLTGMDMVRLALERSKTAEEALSCLISLLETYGQGGNCGFDHDFYYDNAFLIMDRTAIFVLETAGKQWVSKRYTAASISNRLSIGDEGDAYSGGRCDFKKQHLEPLYSTFSGSASRKRQTGILLGEIDSAGSCMDTLRQHEAGVKNPFAAGSVSSVCMHFGGMVGDHTTASMVISLEKDRTLVWNTGCSLPCVSLYKPWVFGTEPILPVVAPGDYRGEQYWLAAEKLRRAFLGKRLPPEFFAQRDAIQRDWITQAAQIPTAEFAAFSARCLEEEVAFFEKWNIDAFDDAPCGKGFRTRWAKKNTVLFPKDLL